jgi:hypothetical protein
MIQGSEEACPRSAETCRNSAELRQGLNFTCFKGFIAQPLLAVGGLKRTDPISKAPANGQWRNSSRQGKAKAGLSEQLS